jgi:hypothetical protein
MVSQDPSPHRYAILQELSLVNRKTRLAGNIHFEAVLRYDVNVHRSAEILAAFPQTAMSHQRRPPALELSKKTHEQFPP